MNHSFKKGILADLLFSHLPNNKDNLSQIIIKLIFVVTLVAMLLSFVMVSCHFFQIKRETDILNSNYELLDKDAPLTTQQINRFLNLNTDFRGYIKIENTNINNPVFQSKNNTFYANHNQLKKKSVFGTLFFDCDNTITYKHTDKNLIIYGNKTENAQLFSQLDNYKNINFYKQNYKISLSTFYSNTTYAIYSVFLANSNPSDDNGYVYNYKQKDFSNENEFNKWVLEAKQRSIINTNITAKFSDNILTLVTDSEEFEGAKLVVMARSLNPNEDVYPTEPKIANNPRYPKIWYQNRGIAFPFENN